MPTVLLIHGWRFFFYSNESNEPIHIHAEKGDMECKFWLIFEERKVIEVFLYNMSPASVKEVKSLVNQHFDYFVEAWNNYFKK